MSDYQDIRDSQTVFDIRAFLFKLLKFWPLFLISLGIAFGVAQYINARKLPVYGMQNMISIKDDQNPFFTSNTSLTFNWGGTTDKVNTAIITLKSRSHNEKVVAQLQYYIAYQKDGEYQKVDAYGALPFAFEADTSKVQLLYTPITVVFKTPTTFALSATLPNINVKTQNYSTKAIAYATAASTQIAQDYTIGDKISLPFFSGTFFQNPEVKPILNTPFYISFKNFDNSVKRYLGISVDPESNGSSILRLGLNGTNKARLVDYLNSSVQVLSNDVLERKNLFATKTIKFIDSSLTAKSMELRDVEKELNSFKNKTAVYDLASEGAKVSSQLTGLDLSKEALQRQLNYYAILEKYLSNRADYREVPAPSVAGIQELSIVSGVGRIISLAEERKKLEYSFKETAPIFADLDRQINAVKNILFENIRSSQSLKELELSDINKDIAKYEGEIRKLPREQQELLKIERRYSISAGTYNVFLSKRSEAGLVKAANVSDVLIIDSAKDTGGHQIGPDTKLNNMLAGFLGFLVPFGFVFILTFFDNKIKTTKDLQRLSTIPILGVIGKSTLKTGLAVIEKPKSSVAESFRALRSSLQFIYKKQGLKGSKTVLVTSSVSGEGKTFTSINIASVFALSEKRTILLGLDLRKPKIFGDFEINNDKGVVNYLINEATIEEITQKTMLPSLDVITSGPIPPNPSELLMSDGMDKLIADLKQKYDFIVIDSPPLGLVADSLELTRFADATIYLARQNYTKKGMFEKVNEKYRKGEITNLSFVLNYVDDTLNYGSGYGYGNYSNGYHEDEKKPPFGKRIKRFVKRK
ncbi:polysaccharide biosynthesis tyrosine autokinase [Patiriisocius sp. Uisw_017]|jgi:capsular exopolysaccharide synthesis family protein|uniref:polysaccharide biosynthesis tyrosine autokinase n=1 Tax=Patiriisocius sp. Uisw_017 TaxID=3230968 RepID=UPI0039ECF6FB